MRKLVSLRRVTDVTPIPDADLIETVRVDGWDVVCKKGDFKVGDYAVYAEIDSFLPTEIAPFLTRPGKEPRIFEGVSGERLRTVRLRKQLSQGLLLPLSCLEDRDLSSVLGVLKWEPPLSGGLFGAPRGNFPPQIRKTDQERIQNVLKVFDDKTTTYEVSLKLDGSSCTVYFMYGSAGVCSRNIDLSLNEENDNNRFIMAAKYYGLLEIVREMYVITGRSFALQGELMGPGIQGNREKFNRYQFFLFDIWDIDNQCYLPRAERLELLADFNALPLHIPAMLEEKTLPELGIRSLEDILKFVDSTLPFTAGYTRPIEGLVFKASDGKSSFKVISNKFLEKERD